MEKSIIIDGRMDYHFEVFTHDSDVTIVNKKFRNCVFSSAFKYTFKECIFRDCYFTCTDSTTFKECGIDRCVIDTKEYRSVNSSVHSSYISFTVGSTDNDDFSIVTSTVHLQRVARRLSVNVSPLSNQLLTAFMSTVTSK